MQAKDTSGRRTKGFARAGGLIGAQMRTASARRGFALARLRALWTEIAGAEFAAITRPEKLTSARGATGGVLSLAVESAHAPQVQMLLPLLRERVNAALGPGTVGRIRICQAPAGFAEAPARFRGGRSETSLPPQYAEMRDGLSSIGDDNLRHALETLALNVLSRNRTSQ